MPVHNKKILLAEDNEINAKLIKDYLTYKKYQVIITSNGNEVIPIVTKEKPNLILMDLQLTGLSGIEVIKQLRADEAHKKIPIIVVSAFSRDKIMGVLSETQFEEFVEKPVEFSSFINLIEKYISKP